MELNIISLNLKVDSLSVCCFHHLQDYFIELSLV
jgi:hypothetical protein